MEDSSSDSKILNSEDAGESLTLSISIVMVAWLLSIPSVTSIINVSNDPDPNKLSNDVSLNGCWYCGSYRCCLTHKYSPRSKAKNLSRNPYSY